MDFLDDSLRAEYDRVLATIEHDPYASQTTLGMLEVLRAHFLIVDFFLSEQREIGGVGPRDVRLLESALHRPWVAFGGITKWVEPLDKAATTLFGLIKDHPFHDANKRTALLSILYLLAKQGRTPTCSKVDFENLMVEIAGMEIIKRARYRELTQSEEDPEVRYISHWLRKNTRDLDHREYSIAYRDLRRILARYGFVLENPHDNAIDVVKIERRTGLAALLAGREVRRRIGRIGYPGDNRQIAKGDVRRIRKLCGLTSKEGIDSQSFYRGVDDMTSLIAEYHDNLRRLANR